MAGTENLKDVLKLFLTFVEDLSESLGDKEITLTDAFNFFDTLQAVGPAIAGIDQIPAELKDLDANEKKELNAFIASEFDIENDKVEMYIEKALAGVLMLAELVPLFTKGK